VLKFSMFLHMVCLGYPAPAALVADFEGLSNPTVHKYKHTSVIYLVQVCEGNMPGEFQLKRVCDRAVIYCQSGQ
jgi:hypothetical protein